MPTTSYMTLNLPTVSVTIGPDWAAQLNAAFVQVDAHDHSPGKGTQVTPAGLNINTDVAFGNNLATGMKGLKLQGQVTLDPGVYPQTLFTTTGDGDLYWNDGTSGQIQITAGGGLNTAALTPTTWPAQDVIGDLAILPANTNALFLIDTSAPRLITLPLASSVAKGRFYDLIDVSGTAATNAITVAPNGFGTDTIDGVNANETLQTNHGRWRFISNGSTKWFVERSSQEIFRVGITRPAAIVVGNGLYGSTTRNAAWGALNLAGGAGWVSGVLPAVNLPDATTGAKGILQIGGDLGGTVTAQTVVQLTGSAGVVSVVAAALNFVDGIAPAIQQVARGTAGSGALMSMTAQNANTSGDGGGITLTTGNAAGAGKKGAFTAKIGSSFAFEAKEVRAGQRVFAIGGITSVTTTEIPVAAPSGGDGIIYLRNAPTPPVVGNQPVGGGVMYAAGGRLGWLGTTFGVGFELDGSLAASATAGAATLPGAPSSFLQINVGGTNYRIPLYNP